MIEPITSRDSARPTSSPSSSRERASWIIGKKKEVLRDVAAERGQHRFRMKLYAVDGQRPVPDGHHLAVRRGRRHLEDVRDADASWHL